MLVQTRSVRCGGNYYRASVGRDSMIDVAWKGACASWAVGYKLHHMQGPTGQDGE